MRESLLMRTDTFRKRACEGREATMIASLNNLSPGVRRFACVVTTSL